MRVASRGYFWILFRAITTCLHTQLPVGESGSWMLPTYMAVSREGALDAPLLYITLDDPLRSEYETIIDTWNAGTIIPTGSVVFYESLRDEKTDSFWLRETVYSLEQLRIQSVSFNAGQFNDLSEGQPSRPKSLSGSLMNITLQFEKLEGQSAPVSGTWPETAFTIDGLSLTKRADKSCAANW